MKLCSINGIFQKDNINFDGKRISRNVVSQLSKNNGYSLTMPNQRNITTSIAELAEIPGEKNLNFLLNVAAKNKYSTNIELEDKPANDWKSMIADAIKKVIAITPFVNSDDKAEYVKKIDEITNKKELNNEEKEILKLRDTLLKSTDIEQIKKETTGGIKDFKRNLDYFIISSETTQEDKKYVLEKLNYLMSYKYHINPQLKDKKSVVVAEIINDLAIATPGHEIPNIKAVNQKKHGMCAAISIVRKKLAYEDKPNYVDSILSELDDSEFMSVYDRTALGSGKKINVLKVKVDFQDALEKGYRIIDASTMHWMQAANNTGYSATSAQSYVPFDRENFGVKTDAFFNAKFEDDKLSDLQSYYQALNKAKELLDDYKASKIKKEVNITERKTSEKDNLKLLSNILQSIREILNKHTELSDKKYIDEAVSSILKLEKKRSIDIKEPSFEYITNEEEDIKKSKIISKLESITNNKVKFSDSEAEDIANLINFYHEIAHSGGFRDKKISEIAKAQTLYEIGAAYRYQFIEGLKVDKVINDYMVAENIIDRESLITKTVDDIIKVLSSKNKERKIIIDILSDKLGLETPSSRAVLKELNAIKENMAFLTETAINNVYVSLAQGGKKESLANYIDRIMSEVENNNDSVIYHCSEALKVQEDKNIVLEKLYELQNKVLNGSEDDYIKAFNLIADKSQLEVLKEEFQNIVETITNDPENSLIDELLNINNLKSDNKQADTYALMTAIAKQIDSMSDSVEKYTKFLTITDSEGNILYSANPADIIVKMYENKNLIPSYKEMKELQKHFDKIAKYKSTDEFNAVRGKIKDKSLTTFTKQEKNTLSDIEALINTYSREIQKQKVIIENYLREPLEELNRQIGVEKGVWWSYEGSSGLYNGQQVRILEYITGRPHHTSEDLEKAIEKIKNSPYSGITGSSVFHDRAGLHAQYVVDIEPVKVKVEDENGNEKFVEKDILFQDNTWGASEHENVWTDKSGLTRTDYSDYRGGTLGYVTNKNYHNGNLVERILNEMVLEEKPEHVNSKQYKKIKRADNITSKSSQYSDIILDGKDPEIYTFAESIQDKFAIPSTSLLDILEKFAALSTQKEITAKLNEIKNSKSNWEAKRKEMYRLIFDTMGFGIDTKEKYNNLPDNNELKLVLEKTALYMNYDLYGYKKEIAEVNNVGDLERFKKIQLENAQDNVRYAFSKDISRLEWLKSSITDKDLNEVNNILKSHAIELDKESYDRLFKKFDIDKKDFNGSLSHTIDLLLQKFNKKLSIKIKNREIEKELSGAMRNVLKNKLYFSSKDLENNKDIEGITKFIDRIYDPDDNDEFVQIFNKLCDMTTEEFNNEILPQFNKKELGINEFSGYDVLSKLRKYNKQAKTAFANTIYWDSDVSDVIIKSTYNHKKYSKETEHLVPRSFEATYRDLKDSLSWLTLPKLFNKYKNANLVNYNAFPAYPRLDYISDNLIKEGFNTISLDMPKIVGEIIALNNLGRYIKLTEELNNLIAEFNDSTSINGETFKNINLIAGEIVTMLQDDNANKEILNAASEILEIEENSEFGKYKDFVNKLIEAGNNYKNSTTEERLSRAIQNKKELLSKQTDYIVNTFIQKRYKSKFNLLLQQYKHALIKEPSKVNELADKLYDEFVSSHILNNPEELLDTYLKEKAKDAPQNNYKTSHGALLERAMLYSTIYEIQATIMDAINSGVESDIKSAFDSVKIALTDGSFITMNDGDFLHQMVCSLILDNNVEPAVTFLDKLGLNEKFINYMSKNIDYDDIKRNIQKAHDLDKNSNDFCEILDTKTKKAYEELSSGSNTIQILSRLKNYLISESAKYSVYDKATDIFKAIDNVKKAYTKNHKTDITDILKTHLNDAIEQYLENVNNEIDEINQNLEYYEEMSSLINSLTIIDTSSAIKEREIINKNFDDIMRFREKLNQEGNKQ